MVIFRGLGFDIWSLILATVLAGRMAAAGEPDQTVLPVWTLGTWTAPDAARRVRVEWPDGSVSVRPTFRNSAGKVSFRFTPRTSGPHRIEAAADSGGRVPWQLRFRADAAGPASMPFVRVSRRDPRYLETVDGRTFLAIGMNACWYGEDALGRYGALFRRMRAAGMNVVRIWLPTWALSIDGEAPGELDATGADLLDRILDRAQAAGVRVVLCLENTADFTEHYDRLPWGGDPVTFFRADAARRGYDAKLRACAARWGEHPALAVWELWNEIDLMARHTSVSAPDAFLDDVLLPWILHSARVLRAADASGRPVTVSLSGDVTWPRLWRAAEIDLVMVHSYVPPPERLTDPLDLDFARKLRTRVRALRRTDKPLWPGEVDFSDRDDDPPWIADLDPRGQHLVNALWSSAMSGSAGTAMPWWWEQVIERRDLFDRFGALARFFHGTDLADEALRPIREPRGAPLELYGLSGPKSAYAWIRDPADGWHSGLVRRAPRRSWNDAAVTLTGLRPGLYRVSWWHPAEGRLLSQATRSVEHGRLRLAAPPFRGSVAVKVIRQRR